MDRPYYLMHRCWQVWPKSYYLNFWITNEKKQEIQNQVGIPVDYFNSNIACFFCKIF